MKFLSLGSISLVRNFGRLIAMSVFLFVAIEPLWAATSKIKDPVEFAFQQASLSNTVAECERDDDSGVVEVRCVSEVFETDLPCADPSSPSGLEMCFGVEAVEVCDFEFEKVGQYFKLVSGPNCETERVE